MTATNVKKIIDYLSEIEKELMLNQECYINGYHIHDNSVSYYTSNGKTYEVSLETIERESKHENF